MGLRRAGPGAGRPAATFGPLLQAPWPFVCAPPLSYMGRGCGVLKEDSVDGIQSHTLNLRLKPKTLGQLVSTCRYTHLVVLKLFDPFGFPEL